MAVNPASNKFAARTRDVNALEKSCLALLKGPVKRVMEETQYGSKKLRDRVGELEDAMEEFMREKAHYDAEKWQEQEAKRRLRHRQQAQDMRSMMEDARRWRELAATAEELGGAATAAEPPTSGPHAGAIVPLAVD